MVAQYSRLRYDYACGIMIWHGKNANGRTPSRQRTPSNSPNAPSTPFVSRAETPSSRTATAPGFGVKDRGYLIPRKSVFNRVIGDSHLELQFASFLENCPDVVSYAKNYLIVHFKLDYVNVDGNISNYYPDFLVKLNDKRIVIIETKGQEDLDVPLKTARLKQWCEDINRAQSDVTYDFVFVDEDSFNNYSPKSLSDLVANFSQYKNA